MRLISPFFSSWGMSLILGRGNFHDSTPKPRMAYFLECIHPKTIKVKTININVLLIINLRDN